MTTQAWHVSVQYRTDLINEIKEYGVKLKEPHKMKIEELEEILAARESVESNPLTLEMYKQYKEQKVTDKRIMMLHGLRRAEYHQWKRENNLTRKTRGHEGMTTVNRNEILTEVLSVLVTQTEKGVRKYGESVNPNNLETIQWLNHAIEEHADAIVYLTVLKKKLEEGEK